MKLIFHLSNKGTILESCLDNLVPFDWSSSRWLPGKIPQRESRKREQTNYLSHPSRVLMLRAAISVPVHWFHRKTAFSREAHFIWWAGTTAHRGQRIHPNLDVVGSFCQLYPVGQTNVSWPISFVKYFTVLLSDISTSVLAMVYGVKFNLEICFVLVLSSSCIDRHVMWTGDMKVYTRGILFDLIELQNQSEGISNHLNISFLSGLVVHIAVGQKLIWPVFALAIPLLAKWLGCCALHTAG